MKKTASSKNNLHQNHKALGIERTISDFVCLYCKSKTRCNNTTVGKFVQSREHIFPKSMGGEKMLVKGDVCDECNNRLSVVDKAFKKNSLMTAFAYQVDDFKQGRKRNPDAIKRHKEEKKHIILDNGGSIIESEVDAVGSCRTTFTNVDFSHYDEHFSRSIHKCIANRLCQSYGSIRTNELFFELIDYVNTGKNPEDWSYAISYPMMIQPARVRPDIFASFLIDDLPITISIIDTSGLYCLGAFPNSLNKNNIEIISNEVAQNDGPYKNEFEKFGKTLYDFYGFKISNYTPIGKLNFHWLKKQLSSERDSFDVLFVLARCKVCNQVNPIEPIKNRALINTQALGSTNGNINEGWNRISKKDLMERGYGIKLIESTLKDYPNSILFPDNAKSKIFPSYKRIQCINCHEWNNFKNKDFFL